MSAYKITRINRSVPQFNKDKLPSPSKNFIYSPLAIEEDQKQIITSKLKQEISLLQKNSSEFDSLKDHYKKLDHEFNGLLKQKQSNDQLFAKHHEAALKEISQIKNQLDQMKSEFREKKIEIEDLEADEHTLRNELDQKQIQIEKLKNQYRSSLADNQQLKAESYKLTQIHKNVLSERENILIEYRKIQEDADIIKAKESQIKGYSSKLKDEQSAVTEKIVNYEIKNNKIDEDLLQTAEDLIEFNQEIETACVQISELQHKLVEQTSFAQKFKTQSLYHKKAAQHQIMLNNDLLKNISQAENISQVRSNQAQEGHQQLEQLNQQTDTISKINSTLEQDLQSCRRHLQNLAALNKNLVEHMKNITQQDQQVRVLVDRRSRIQRADERVRQVEYSLKNINMNQTRHSLQNSYNSTRRYY